MAGDMLIVHAAVVFGLVLFQTIAADDRVQCGKDCLTCSQATGSCTSCTSGKWGPNCENTCHVSTCMMNACDIETGYCTYGCMDGMYSTWDGCLPCPANCKRCEHEALCTECVDGRYGSMCDKRCSRGCKHCKQTYSGQNGTTCLRCAPGKYGLGFVDCLYDCSLCRNGACAVEKCKHGCIPGYYSHKSACVKCFPECASCNFGSWNNKKCLTCPPGRWGDLCDQDCPGTCESNVCDQSTGICQCASGEIHGDDVTCRGCPDHCDYCNSAGECTQCAGRRFGPSCDQICSRDCRTCTGTSQNCTSCPTDRFLSPDNRCRRCPPGCTECNWIDEDLSVSCTKCKPGFFKDIRKDRGVPDCYKCPVGCSVCDWFGNCMECAADYRLFLHRCCPIECAECTSYQQCTVCAEGQTCDLTKDSDKTGYNMTLVNKQPSNVNSGSTDVFMFQPYILIGIMLFGTTAR